MGRALAGIPAAAWSRILVLSLALASIKLALLVGLGSHLSEIHWRVGGPRTTWCHPAIPCYLFICLGVLSLARLGRHCRSGGARGAPADWLPPRDSVLPVYLSRCAESGAMGAALPVGRSEGCPGGQRNCFGVGAALHLLNLPHGRKQLSVSNHDRDTEVDKPGAVSQPGLFLSAPVPGRLAVRLRLHLLRTGAHGPRIVGASLDRSLRGRICALVPARTPRLPRRTVSDRLCGRGFLADLPAPRQEITACLVGRPGNLECRLCRSEEHTSELQ